VIYEYLQDTHISKDSLRKMHNATFFVTYQYQANLHKNNNTGSASVFYSLMKMLCLVSCSSCRPWLKSRVMLTSFPSVKELVCGTN
jgi:hypothetical protein